MKPAPIAVLAAVGLSLGLSACAEGYGYAYDYGPGGPRGHYVSPFDKKKPAPACQKLAYSGPYENGYSGTYYAGPYCLDGGGQGWVAVAR